MLALLLVPRHEVDIRGEGIVNPPGKDTDISNDSWAQCLALHSLLGSIVANKTAHAT